MAAERASLTEQYGSTQAKLAETAQDERTRQRLTAKPKPVSMLVRY